MEHNDKAGGAKFRHACSLPLTGRNAVDMIITDLAVFARPDRAGAPFKLIEMAPGVTPDELRAKTEARYE
jgi:acyl CoA:acetate/3-ketoacid CoA transferase beta subunit